MSIPKRLIRTVPEVTGKEVDDRWVHACELHPDWQYIDLRDPLDPIDFPLTSHLWDSCESGSQKSDLIRAEELYWNGGFYIDSDVECYRPFDGLLGLRGVVAYEDMDHICTAVMGFEQDHPALKALIEGGIEHHHEGAWAAAIGVASKIFPGRNDMAILPPGSFFPVHYHRRWTNDMPSHTAIRYAQPWAYCCHLWDGSWLESPPV